MTQGTKSPSLIRCWLSSYKLEVCHVGGILTWPSMVGIETKYCIRMLGEVLMGSCTLPCLLCLACPGLAPVHTFGGLLLLATQVTSDGTG